MTEDTIAPATADVLIQSKEFTAKADETAEGLYGVIAIRNQFPGWLGACSDEIALLLRLQPDWNSYGANPVDWDSINIAKLIIRELSKVTGIECPRVAATAEGNVPLSWDWENQTR